MDKEDLLEKTKKKFEEEDELVFEASQFSSEDRELIEKKFKEMTSEGYFFCETVLRCPKGHPTKRIASLPEHESSSKEPPYCSLCEDYLTSHELTPDLKFILSTKVRKEILEEEEEKEES